MASLIFLYFCLFLISLHSDFLTSLKYRQFIFILQNLGRPLRMGSLKCHNLMVSLSSLSLSLSSFISFYFLIKFDSVVFVFVDFILFINFPFHISEDSQWFDLKRAIQAKQKRERVKLRYYLDEVKRDGEKVMISLKLISRPIYLETDGSFSIPDFPFHALLPESKLLPPPHLHFSNNLQRRRKRRRRREGPG